MITADLLGNWFEQNKLPGFFLTINNIQGGHHWLQINKNNKNYMIGSIYATWSLEKQKDVCIQLMNIYKD